MIFLERAAFALLVALATTPICSAQIEVEELPAPLSPESPPAAQPNSDVPTPAVPDELAALEAEAQSTYSDGDLAKALALYLDLGNRHQAPAERARVLVLAAWLSWQLQDFPGALAHFEAALFEQPDAPFAPENYSPEFAALQQDALASALSHRRRTASEKINRAAAELRAGKTGAARILLGEALQLAPDDPDAVYNLALADMREKRDDAALAGFQRVLALERGNPEGITAELKGLALNNAAVIYYGRGEHADAESLLEEAVGLTPEDSHAWFNLGLTRQKLGRQEAGYEALRRARSLAPNNIPISRALALAEIERGSWVSAVALLVAATDVKPTDADLRLHLGRAQRGLGNVAGALESFRQALAADSDGAAGIGATAALLLAETLRGQGDFAGSGEAAARVVAIQPNDAGGWMLFGLSKFDRGDPAGALEALARGRQLAPDRADIAHNLGTVYLALQDYDRAEVELRAALLLDPSNGETRSALDRLLARQVPPTPPPSKTGEIGARLAVADYEPLGIRGLRVDAVQDGSIAAKGGLRAGDLILRAEGKSLDSIEALKKILKSKRGALLDVLRDGKPIQIRIILN